jgi:hypothetical protein
MATRYPTRFSEQELPTGPTLFFKVGAISRNTALAIRTSDGPRLFLRRSDSAFYFEVGATNGEGAELIDVGMPHDSDWIAILTRSTRLAGHSIACLRLRLASTTDTATETPTPLLLSNTQHRVSRILGPAHHGTGLICITSTLTADVANHAIMYHTYYVSEVDLGTGELSVLFLCPTNRFATLTA